MRGETSEAYEMTSTFLQGGIRPLAGYQQPGNMTMQSQSPEPAWQFNSITPKQEPIDEARNDSGINSGSDCPSASPGSDHSGNIPFNSPPQNNNLPVSNHEATPFNPTSQGQYHAWYRHNFMTSPNSLEERNLSQSENSQLSTSYHSSSSPKLDSGDENTSEFDDKGIRIPKVNSHGKIKVHKCKQCDFVAYTKLDFWDHSKVHIKGDKILKCPRCPFVTEYKHHLEYHLLNHAGAKPFKCDHCDYSCVNKSMLNSHLKSHSKVYQYRCSDCLYETKYCHSLKLHLRKYKHKPAMVLNPDGSPNPLPIIDVYGTRRGPKVKKHPNLFPETSSSPNLEQQQTPLPFNPALNQLMMNSPSQLPFPFPFHVGGFPGPIPNPEMLQNIQRIFRERMQELAKQQTEEKMETGVLDLSKPVSGNSSEDDEGETTMFSIVEVGEEKKEEPEVSEAETTIKDDSTSECQREEISGNMTNNNKYDFSCQYCGICFGDEVLFRIHMGYHGYSNAFTCNSCGEECKDKVNFFLHIARAPH